MWTCIADRLEQSLPLPSKYQKPVQNFVAGLGGHEQFRVSGAELCRWCIKGMFMSRLRRAEMDQSRTRSCKTAPAADGMRPEFLHLGSKLNLDSINWESPFR